MPTTKPARAVWLPWPIAVALAPLFWLLPKRMGPHFAAVRWPGVIVAHLLWTIYGISCIVIAYQAPRYSWVAYLLGESPRQQAESIWPAPTVSEIARSPLAMSSVTIVVTVHRSLAIRARSLGVQSCWSYRGDSSDDYHGRL